MVIKTGPAAIVLTSVTVKSVVFGCLGILSIHDGKNALQPIKESGQNGIVEINRRMCQSIGPNRILSDIILSET